jgi:RimJ/RimL family protein N-acetyltransferase
MEGKLVRIRAYETFDLDAVMAWVNDQEVTRNLGGGPLAFPVSRVQEEQFLEVAARSGADATNKVFAIETIAERKYIGGIDLRGINWLDRQAEIGIVIGDKSYWSKGYGTDAMRVIMRIGFDQMALNKLWLKVLAFNQRALRCYEKCGFRREGVLREDRFVDGKYYDGIVMGILEREYRAAVKTW